MRALLVALAAALALAAPVAAPLRERARTAARGLARPPLERLRARRRRRLLEAQLPAVVTALAAQVRAGRSVAQAIAAAAADAPAPAKGALVRAGEALRLGGTPERALAALDAGPDLALVLAALRLHARAGGDLAQLLDGLAEAMHERAAQRRAAAVATAQARVTGRIVSAMPLLGLLALRLLDPAALGVLLESPLGWLALALSAALTLAGQLLIARIAAPQR